MSSMLMVPLPKSVAKFPGPDSFAESSAKLKAEPDGTISQSYLQNTV